MTRGEAAAVFARVLSEARGDELEGLRRSRFPDVRRDAWYADYVAYLHQGKLQFVRPKDTLLYEFGVVKCGKKEFAKMDTGDFLAWRENAFEVQALTENRRSAQRKYPDCVIDPAGLEDIMLLYSKGTQGRGRERP